MVGEDVTTQAHRLHAIAELAERIRSRARDLDERAAFPVETFAELRAAGLLALTAPAQVGGAGLWSAGRYRPYYEVLEALARIDSVTAQLLQVHSHALGIVSGLADATQREALVGPIVARGGLLASVGSEARPSGRLADIARAELEERPDGGYRLSCQKYFASGSSAADELLIWTAVPGAGPYSERSLIVLVPADAPEVELIDQWDVMGMRATVSHSVRITRYDVPPERLIGEPGAWTRRDPRTFTLAFAANHIGAAGAAMDFTEHWVRERPGLAASEITRATLGRMSSDLFAARSALWAAADLWDAGDADAAELASIRTLHLGKRLALDLTQTAFDVAGARAVFRDQGLERLYRDVRTFSLHYRDDQYMVQVGQAMLDCEFRAKGYAGASTFPESRA
ncbi:MAG: acyl-CoA dehydrogenase family protein [Solirubrobacteraceae bacterium]